MADEATTAWACDAIANETEKLACFIQQWADTALDYAILFAAAGTIAMAAIEVLRGVFRLRARFHKKQIDAWIGADGAKREQLLALAAGGAENEMAWWDQSTEQLFSRLHAAADTTLDFPADYQDFYDFLTQDLGARSKEDAQAWSECASAWRTAMRGLGGNEPVDTAAPAQTSGSTTPTKGPAKDPADLRARLGAAVARRLDALQMGVEWRWTKLVQAAAVPLGTGLFYWIQYGSEIDTCYALLLSVVAGLTAPFAKDVVTRLRGVSLRGRFATR